MRRLIVAVMTFGLMRVALGTGIMIPKRVDVSPLAIKYHRVDVAIEGQVAQTKVDQAFINHTSRQLEATYVFPLPKEASVSDFAMFMNGKRVSGELIERNKARRIYQDIVRRMRDPGLLEYLGGNLFKASVFPIPPRGVQKVELSYSQVVSMDGGICQYTYPLKTGEKASRVQDDFTVRVKLKSTVPLKSIYSPSHEIDITRKGNHEASVGLEASGVSLDKDFVLYYTASEKDFGLSLLTHRKKGDDGYFMLLISPKAELSDAEIAQKDMCFVIDTSGSMSGEKIDQARQALKYCVNSLRAGDKFNIVRFSTDVENFSEGLQAASKQNLKKAIDFIDQLAARGGTDINSALRAALAMKTDAARPYLVVFLTDGKPTIGEVSEDAIVKNVADRDARVPRVFTFGVGYDVNTHLLDKVAARSRGASEYVKPAEDIEVKVSRFYDKASRPVLADLALDVGQAGLYDVYPKQLPDLFSGMQLLVLGRYKKDGHVAIKLSGQLNEQKKELVYEGDFPADAADNRFIPQLWATRKIGYLLEEIRLHGQQKELVDEVIALSKEHGVMTPYTSYLVVEDERRLSLNRETAHTWSGRASGYGGNLPRARERDKAAAAAPAGKAGARDVADVSIEELDRAMEGAKETELAVMGTGKPRGATRDKKEAEERLDSLSAAQFEDLKKDLKSLSTLADARTKAYAAKKSGREAVMASEAIAAYKGKDRPDQAGASSALTKMVRKKVFYRVEGVWTDQQYKPGTATVKIKYASDAYLALIEKAPDLKDYLLLGEKVIVVLKNGKCLEIAEEGKETLTDAELADLLGG